MKVMPSPIMGARVIKLMDIKIKAKHSVNFAAKMFSTLRGVARRKWTSGESYRYSKMTRIPVRKRNIRVARLKSCATVTSIVCNRMPPASSIAPSIAAFSGRIRSLRNPKARAEKTVHMTATPMMARYPNTFPKAFFLICL